MNTNNSNRIKSYPKVNTFLQILNTKTINKMARLCEYTKRKGGKISPTSLILGFLLMVSNKRNTFSDWATQIGFLEGTTISKQSVFERMSKQTECFIKNVLEYVMKQEGLMSRAKKLKGILKHFKNVFIDDSTTLGLSDELSDVYPGNVSNGIKKSQVKIHAMFNLTKGIFSFFHICSFRNNDQSLSGDVLPFLKKGDLCIRDLGFTVLNVMNEFIKRGIFFVARKGFNVLVYDLKTKEEIDLLKRLRKNGFIDAEVLIGKTYQIKCRLVIVSIPNQQSEARKRKASKDRDLRLNHSKYYYELLGYNVFVTNIPIEKCNATEIVQIYKLRWRIEIIFKSWKSSFSLQRLMDHPCKNESRVKCNIYLMLIYIYLFHVIWFNYCEKQIHKRKEAPKLSLLKMANFFCNHFEEILSAKNNKSILEQIMKHCIYDTRKDRQNAEQLRYNMAA